MHPQIEAFVDNIAERIAAEPDLDDFLTWTAGTLEYWVHIVASSVGRRIGWASTTEVPYITGSPALGTKTDTKWADGAAVLSGSVGVLLEVKTIPARYSVPGPTMKKIPADLAALVSADWQRTLEQLPDDYSGAAWKERRAQMDAVYGLQLALVHGEVDVTKIDVGVRTGIDAGLQILAHRYPTPPEPAWLRIVHEAFLGGDRMRRVISGRYTNSVLYAWSAPIPR